ncbi:MAG TPA: capsule assembly Wzi family protein, partial [Gemmatimonadaceae bacterium]
WAQPLSDGGLFLAEDAPALDQVSLSSDQPFALPGFLRPLGLAKGVIVVADLGPSQVRSYSKLLAYKVSIAPNRTFECGASFMNHFGGEGAPATSFSNRVVDFLPFIDIFRRHNYTDTTRTLDAESDKLMGVDGLLRLGGRYGVILTGELLIDDFDVHRMQQIFTGNGSQAFGLAVPRFISPLVSLKLTATHMGIETYTHAQLTNGITTRGRLLGNELGPDAKAFGARLTWQPMAAFQLGFDGRSAIYSNATYVASYSDAAQTDFGVRKVARTADELRDRLGTFVIVQSDAGPAVTFRFVTERSRNYQFQGFRRTDSAAELAIHLLF